VDRAYKMSERVERRHLMHPRHRVARQPSGVMAEHEDPASGLHDRAVLSRSGGDGPKPSEPEKQYRVETVRRNIGGKQRADQPELSRRQIRPLRRDIHAQRLRRKNRQNLFYSHKEQI